MFANCQIPGVNFSFPDICLTPPPPPGIPIPYLNVSLNCCATGFSTKVLWMCTPAHRIVKTKIPVSFGDEPGIGLGLISRTIKGTTYFLTGAFTVLVQKLPGTRMTSITLQNKFNMIGMTLVPGQFRVLLLSA